MRPSAVFISGVYYFLNNTQSNPPVGKQRELNLDIWPVLSIGNVGGYSCV